MNVSQRRRTAGPRPWPSLPTTIASGPRRSVWRAVNGASASEPAIRSPRTWRSASAPGQVVDRAEQQVLDGAGRGLDRGRAERRLAAGREDDAVDARRLGASQQRADVLGVLERIEDEDERRLAALGRPGEDVVERGEPARLDHERDPLVAVEPGQRGQRAALDLDDRDAQAGGMEDELLERVPALRDDEQAMGGPAGGEDLLDRAAAGDELLVGAEQVRRRQRRRRPRPGRGIRAGPAARTRTRAVARGPPGARSAVAGGTGGRSPGRAATVRWPRPRSRRRDGSRRTVAVGPDASNRSRGAPAGGPP